MKDIVIVDGARTPMAEYNGHFSDISAIDLAVIASKEALTRSGIAPEEIDHVIVGNALQTSGDAIYGARHVGLKAGVPKNVPALTVNRLCGSGIQSVINAAEQIQLDEATTVLAGGMENMSQAPFVVRGARKGLRLGQAPMEDSLMVALLDSYAGLYMAPCSSSRAPTTRKRRTRSPSAASCRGGSADAIPRSWGSARSRRRRWHSIARRCRSTTST